MKYLIQALLGLALLTTVACKSGGSQASSTVKKLTAFETELTKGKNAINDAVKTLNTLYEPGGDMAEEYDAFAKAVGGVESQRDRVRKTHESLKTEKAAFVAAWEEGLAGIQNASMKERAMERRDAVVKEFEDLSSSGQDTREMFDQWFQDLNDIKTVLSFDLNPTGVKELEDDIESITKRANKINDGIGDFTEAVGNLIDALEAAKPPEPES